MQRYACGLSLALLAMCAAGFRSTAYAQEAASVPAPPSDGAKPTVRLTANQDGVQFLLWTGQGEIASGGYLSGSHGSTMISGDGERRDYAVLCAAPCATMLPAGTHRLALSLPGGRVIEPDEPVEISRGSSLHGTYESRAGVRAAGVVLALASLAAGGVMVAASIHSSTCDRNGACTNGIDEGLAWGGVAVVSIGGLAGVVMAVIRDRAAIEVVPNSDAPATSALTPRTERTALLRPAPVTGTGLTLRYRF
jgi:hypothetical protein